MLKWTNKEEQNSYKALQYPRCVTHLQEMKKIIIKTSYTPGEHQTQ